MEFKRMEGFVGSAPQSFIDNNLKICPLCGSNNPHWSISQKMQFKLEGNLYLFKCEQCNCVLSAPIPDVTGFNNTVLTTTGLLKKLSGKKNGTIYMKIYDSGNCADMASCVGNEYILEDLNKMAQEKCSDTSDIKRFY